MKCLILAAGYATRLRPLTDNFPKPLLKVGGRTIVDWLVDDLSAEGKVDGFVVVTNHRFAGFFEEWGRYWIYSNGLQHCEGRGVPIGYAIGHFGAEIVILTVYPLLSRAPELFGAVQAGVVIYERIVACAGHTALSILVWDAFCRRDKKRLAFAVLIHAVCDAPLGMLRYGLLPQGPAELLFGAFVTVLCILALRTWRKMPAGAIIRA